MKTVAKLSADERRELFRNTADKMGLNDAIVEKDFGYVSCWIIFSTALHGRNTYHLKEEPAFQKHTILLTVFQKTLI